MSTTSSALWHLGGPNGDVPESRVPIDSLARRVVALANPARYAASTDGIIRIPDDRCSGFLLTPGLVLTSNQCLRADRLSDAPDVYVDADDRGAVRRIATLGRPRVPPGRAVGQRAEVGGLDLAIVRLREPVLEATWLEELKGSLEPFRTEELPPGSAPLSVLFPSYSLVGWSPLSPAGVVVPEYRFQRQGRDYQNGAGRPIDALYRYPTSAGSLFLRPAWDQFGVQPKDGLARGDEGSALLVQRGGRLTLVGIASLLYDSDDARYTRYEGVDSCWAVAGQNVCDAYTDLTEDAARTFVLEGVLRHDGRRWTYAHAPGQRPRPFVDGQVDYLGPCRRDEDADCDHWLDRNASGGGPRDNCPGLYNPLQDDADDDGRGDACDLCPAVASAENVACVPKAFADAWARTGLKGHAISDPETCDGVVRQQFIAFGAGQPGFPVDWIHTLFAPGRSADALAPDAAVDMLFAPRMVGPLAACRSAAVEGAPIGGRWIVAPTEVAPNGEATLSIQFANEEHVIHVPKSAGRPAYQEVRVPLASIPGASAMFDGHPELAGPFLRKVRTASGGDAFHFKNALVYRAPDGEVFLVDGPDAPSEALKGCDQTSEAFCPTAEEARFETLCWTFANGSRRCGRRTHTPLPPEF